MSNETDQFLSHYGKKGMKWGVTTSDKGSSSSGDSDSSSGKVKKKSRKEVRQINKEGAKAFYEKRLDATVSKAIKKGDDVLIETLLAGDSYRSIMTGKEFVSTLSTGRAFNIRATDVFANKNGDAFEINENRNSAYQKVKR